MERNEVEDPGPLLEGNVRPDPLEQFGEWYRDAWEAGVEQADAMVLATSDPTGRPSARAVIVRSVDHGFVFYTNRHSQKGRDLSQRVTAAGCFLWLPLHRQVRIEGPVEMVSRQEADAYFATRPRGSQISAAVSPQSRVVDSRRNLEELWAEFDLANPGDVPRPEQWTGYRLIPEVVEFWQGRPNRFHDRLRYRRDDSGWIIERLAP